MGYRAFLRKCKVYAIVKVASKWTLGKNSNNTLDVYIKVPNIENKHSSLTDNFIIFQL